MVRSSPWPGCRELTQDRDVPDARRSYPTLQKGVKDPLKGLYRTTKILLGYRPSVKITISNKQTWTSISNMIEKQKKSAGGGVNILGFHFGASGGASNTHGWSQLQTSSVGSGGQIVVAPAPEGLTYMLGALGTKV